MQRLSRNLLNPRRSSDASDSMASDQASPASRLRAAMNRLGPDSPAERQAGPPSESDVDLNPVFSARKSLKDVFSRAMRRNTDSPDSKASSSHLRLDAEDEQADENFSDSGLPLSSQAASLQLLRQRLELPEMSSRMDASHSTAWQRTVHEHDRATDESSARDVSTETARDTVDLPNAQSVEFHATPNRKSSNAITREEATPTVLAGTSIPATQISDDETETSHTRVNRTPKPPGGWFTPARPTENDLGDDSHSQSIWTKTPAPPGAWKSTPASKSSRRGVLKPSAQQNELGQPSISGDESLESIAAGVNLVDSYGRLRRFDENGEERQQPLVGLVRRDDSPRRNASVRLVDNLGNDLDILASSNVESSIVESDEIALPSRLERKITQLKQGLETAESRHQAFRQRRVVKQDAIPHERILELAMDSRGARIEREKLLRKSHQVREQGVEIASHASRLYAHNPVETTRSPTSNGWSFLLLLIPIIMLLLLYLLARAYIRHYFTTNYYDPFFATVDPVSLHRIPFVKSIQLPRRWNLFSNRTTAWMAIGANKRFMALVSKSIEELDIKLPS